MPLWCIITHELPHLTFVFEELPQVALVVGGVDGFPRQAALHEAHRQLHQKWAARILQAIGQQGLLELLKHTDPPLKNVSKQGSTHQGTMEFIT